MINEKLNKLKELFNDGYLTEEEFNKKASKLNTDKNRKEKEQTSEYKKLKDLYDDGILTKEEFESKVDRIVPPQKKHIIPIKNQRLI